MGVRSAMTSDLSTSRPIRRVDVAYRRFDPTGIDRIDADALDGVQGGATAEHGQPAEQGALALVEQVVTPVDEVAERLLPGLGRAWPADNRAKRSSMPLDEVGQAHRPQPRRGQLDGQRQAVEPFDQADRRPVRDESLDLQFDACRRCSGPSSSTDSSGVSGGIAQIRSPATASGSRLVASTLTESDRRSTVDANRAALTMTCSQLSSTSSVRSVANSVDDAVYFGGASRCSPAVRRHRRRTLRRSQRRHRRRGAPRPAR